MRRPEAVLARIEWGFRHVRSPCFLLAGGLPADRGFHLSHAVLRRRDPDTVRQPVEGAFEMIGPRVVARRKPDAIVPVDRHADRPSRPARRKPSPRRTASARAPCRAVAARRDRPRAAACRSRRSRPSRPPRTARRHDRPPGGPAGSSSWSRRPAAGRVCFRTAGASGQGCKLQPAPLQLVAEPLGQADIARRLAHQRLIGPVGAAAVGDLEIAPPPFHAVVLRAGDGVPQASRNRAAPSAGRRRRRRTSRRRCRRLAGDAVELVEHALAPGVDRRRPSPAARAG